MTASGRLQLYKAVPDGFVSLHLLEDVKVRDRLSSTGPMGGFFHNPLSHSNEVVYLTYRISIPNAINGARPDLLSTQGQVLGLK